MSFKTFCDICKKEIAEREDEFSVSGRFHRQHYHKDCWADKNNWPKIHKIEK